jgi:hypothetical protein
MQIGKHIASFDSLREMHDYMQLANTKDPTQRDAWFGGLSPKQRRQFMLSGDQSCVPQAERMLSKFDIRLPTDGYAMQTDMAGFMPSVPDYIAGAPECMYAMAATHDARQPMSIVVNGSCSEAITHDQLQRRGTVILAAVMALAAMRPVTLESIVTIGSHQRIEGTRDDFAIVRTRINTTPLDLPSAGYALAHAGWIRGCAYAVCFDKLDANGKWPTIGGSFMGSATGARSEESMRSVLAVLDANPQESLFIPGTHVYDPLLTDPERWINTVLERYGS